LRILVENVIFAPGIFYFRAWNISFGVWNTCFRTWNISFRAWNEKYSPREEKISGEGRKNLQGRKEKFPGMEGKILLGERRKTSKRGEREEIGEDKLIM